MEKKSIESHMHAKVTRGEVNSYDTCKVEVRPTKCNEVCKENLGFEEVTTC